MEQRQLCIQCSRFRVDGLSKLILLAHYNVHENTLTNGAPSKHEQLKCSIISRMITKWKLWVSLFPFFSLLALPHRQRHDDYGDDDKDDSDQSTTTTTTAAAAATANEINGFVMSISSESKI